MLPQSVRPQRVESPFRSTQYQHQALGVGLYIRSILFADRLELTLTSATHSRFDADNPGVVAKKPGARTEHHRKGRGAHVA